MPLVALVLAQAAEVARQVSVQMAQPPLVAMGGAGLTLTNLDTNLTSANFTTFTGMTVICSGGGGGSWGNTAGSGGTGAGNGSTNNTTAGSATAFGCGGGGGGYASGDGGSGGNGYAGLVIVRYAA